MKENNKTKKKKIEIYKILSTLTIILSIGYLTYSLIFVDSILTNIRYLSNSIFIFILSAILFIISIKIKIKKEVVLALSLVLIIFIGFNFMNDINIIKLPTEEKIISYINKPYKTLNEWAEKKGIKINIKYEYSDTIEQGNIIRLDINEGTPVKEIKNITVTLSDGPNYDKIVVVPSMIGWKIDDVTKFIKDNYIEGVKIEYEFSDDEKDTIIKQSQNGDIRRDQEWTLTASLGKVSELPVDVETINLVNMNLFNSTLWLKKNNIKFEIIYEFSNKINKNIVLKQNIKEKETININETAITLTVSKGKAIIVPDLINMTTDEITKWIVESKLKVNFEEIYDESVKTGKVIKASANKGDKLEAGSLVTITLSKGQIKMQNFNSLYEFKEWANKYNIAYSESYEYSNSVGKGYVISYSYQENEIIDPDGIIYVKVSLGKAVTIPSFIGKSKGDVVNTCSSIGINCSFVIGNYTSYDANIIYTQSKGEGSRVTSGSSITLTLSKGIPTTKQLVIQNQWIGKTANSTIETLKNNFSKTYPGVTFNFKTVKHNTFQDGMLVNGNGCTWDNDDVKQGETYTICVVSN